MRHRETAYQSHRVVVLPCFGTHIENPNNQKSCSKHVLKSKLCSKNKKSPKHFFFMFFSLVAQDFGPVDVDLDGYVDDRAGALVKETSKVKLIKTVVKPKEIKKPTRTKKGSATSKKDPVKDFVPELGVVSGKGGDSSMLYIIIAVIVVVIVVVLLLVIKKQKSANKVVAAPKTLSEKIAETEVSTIRSTSSVLERTHMSSAEEDMQQKYASEVSIDERGRNPSGIIIDEDKYFTAGAVQFIDEDRT